MNRILRSGAPSCRQLMRLGQANACQMPRLLSLSAVNSGRSNLPVFREPFSSLSPFTGFNSMFRQMERTMRDLEDSFFGRPAWPRRFFEDSKEVLEDFPEVKYTSKDFTVKINVSKFVIGDLKCELVDNNVLALKGTIEQKSDRGYSKQEMVREFALPEDVDRETLQTSIDDNGVLTITAKVKGGTAAEQRKEIKIEKTTKSTDNATKSETKSA